jgi:CHAD domain-containing protein
MSLLFEMPTSLDAETFIAKLSHYINTRLISRQKIQATFYDSFDWRLYSNNLVGEFIRAKPASSFQLKSLENSVIIASTEITAVPAFSSQFKPGKMRKILEPLLEMRALLAVCTFDYQIIQLNVLNKDEKTILRLIIESYGQFNNRVSLQPIKGYEKAAEHITELFITKLALTITDKPILLAVLQLEGRHPLDYSSKLAIKLEPGLRADIAAKTIFRYLLKTVKANEQGTIADTDSEFLHDFRVAVRRTRTGLSQLKGVFPEKINAQFAEFFSWLGQITGPSRDLDVYLLNFEHYKSSLPVSIREDINPLYDFLLTKKQKAQKELAHKLRSQKYSSTLAAWEEYLNEPVCSSLTTTDGILPIKEFADLRIWKNYLRVLRQGRTLTEKSSAETFHELRKTCKKLRYLIEFFQSLYPEKQIAILIKSLKSLQEVLGDFQDYEVQKSNLKQFSNEMLTSNVPVNTFLAMGVLIQNLEANKSRVRKLFESRYDDYKQTIRQLDLDELFRKRM